MHVLPPELKLNPASKWRRVFLLLVFLLAMVACICLQSIWSIVLVAILLFLLPFYWQSRLPFATLSAQADGVLLLHDADGGGEAFQLLPSSVLVQYCIVLHLQGERGKQALVLWPDSAPVEELRQWRVWLRWTWPALQRQAGDADDA